MRTAFSVAGVLAWAFGTLGAAVATSGSLAGQMAPGYSLEMVALGVDAPTSLVFLPNGELLVSQGDGTVSLLQNATVIPLVVIPVSYCTFADYETGLLGMTADPDFDTNGFLYFFRTAGTQCAPTHNEVIRLTMKPNGTISLSSLVVLMADIAAYTPYHMGGCLRFGPDGKLYVGTGDNYVGDDAGTLPGMSTNPYAQDLSVLMGKILRVNADGSAPNDNPFVGKPNARPEIWAYGMRNPWRFEFDPQTGFLWVADVGEHFWEEINLVKKGDNLSWPHCEGLAPEGCAGANEVKPLVAYPHYGDGSYGTAVVGGVFAPPEFGFNGGQYFFSDFTGHKILRAKMDKKRTGFDGIVEFADAGSPVDLRFGPDGALYFANVNDGQVLRIVPESGGSQPVAGSSLKLKAGSSKKLAVQSDDVVELGAGGDNPVTQGGTLRVYGNGFDNTYPLPAKRWKLLGTPPDDVTGFRYKDSGHKEGPIGLVEVLAGKQIRIKGGGKGLGHELGDTDPGPVTVTLTIGQRMYCMSFGGTTTLKPGKLFTAEGAPAPASCP
jgi:glucose/arabinose dehydrogenase